MILIDPRAGSAELLEYILATPGHPPAEHSTLTYGDVAFAAQGPAGTMLVGVELKTIKDAVNCIETGRFTGHQLPGLKETYDAAYLMLIGDYRCNWNTGALELQVAQWGGKFAPYKTGSRTWKHYEFTAWLTMVELGWGVRLRRVYNMQAAAQEVMEMYRVLQKPWEDHHTLNTWYLGPDTGVTGFVKPGLVERVVMQVEGIGPAKAKEIGKRFSTVSQMVGGVGCEPEALPLYMKDFLKKWKGIPGVGKPTAERIITQFWKEKP